MQDAGVCNACVSFAGNGHISGELVHEDCVAVFTFDCVSRRTRACVCAHLSSLRLNLHACTRACVYLSSIEREQEQQCVSM